MTERKQKIELLRKIQAGGKIMYDPVNSKMIAESFYEKLYYETFNKLHQVQEENWELQNTVCKLKFDIADLDAALKICKDALEKFNHYSDRCECGGSNHPWRYEALAAINNITEVKP